MLQIERALQQEIMLRLRVERWPVIALPHPNAMFIPTHDPAEKALVRRIIYQMKNMGMLVTGAPDLSLHWRGGSALVELKRPAVADLLTKRPAGRLSPEQTDMAKRAREVGVRFAVVHSWDEMRECLEGWGVERDV
jgi:VRR-NUC domain-containing protein